MTPLESEMAWLSDEELFLELRVQVNKARNNPPHDSDRAKAIGAEMKRRGWAIRTPSLP